MPFATNNSVKIYYELIGEGPPILLHTGAGGDGQMWQQADYVAGLEGYQRILMDHRGHGRSDKPQASDAHLLERYVGDVIAVLDNLGIEQTTLWGYSDGGRVGFALAAAFPERVAWLISLGAPGRWDSEQKEGRRLFAELVRAKGIQVFLDEIERSEEITLPAWLEQQFLETDAEMFALELETFTQWEGIWERMSQVQTPSIFLAGDKEDSEKLVELVGEKMPNGRGVPLAGFGHVDAFLQTDLVLSLVDGFLQDLPEAHRG